VSVEATTAISTSRVPDTAAAIRPSPFSIFCDTRAKNATKPTTRLIPFSMIAAGMLVDNAVVVMESIYRIRTTKRRSKFILSRFFHMQHVLGLRCSLPSRKCQSRTGQSLRTLRAIVPRRDLHSIFTPLRGVWIRELRKLLNPLDLDSPL